KGIAEATVSSVNQQSSASFTSLAGDIHLLPAESTGRPLTRILPPSFNVNSQTGNIFVHGDLDFWPSPVRHITFSAGNSITGVATNSNLIPQIGLCQLSCPQTPIIASPNQTSISLTAGSGDISSLKLNLSDPLQQTVTLSAGRDIAQVFGVFSLPDLGVDASGQPIPAVAISAGRNVDMTVPAGRGNAGSGFLFGGIGAARIAVGQTMDLGNSLGIVHRVNSTAPSTDSNKGGLLEIAVGGDLKMSQSRIQTQNGGDIFIHGLNVNRLAGTA